MVRCSWVQTWGLATILVCWRPWVRSLRWCRVIVILMIGCKGILKRSVTKGTRQTKRDLRAERSLVKYRGRSIRRYQLFRCLISTRNRLNSLIKSTGKWSWTRTTRGSKRGLRSAALNVRPKNPFDKSKKSGGPEMEGVTTAKVQALPPKTKLVYCRILPVPPWRRFIQVN